MSQKKTKPEKLRKRKEEQNPRKEILKRDGTEGRPLPIMSFPVAATGGRDPAIGVEFENLPPKGKKK